VTEQLGLELDEDASLNNWFKKISDIQSIGATGGVDAVLVNRRSPGILV
jgi:hypothetical protein